MQALADASGSIAPTVQRLTVGRDKYTRTKNNELVAEPESNEFGDQAAPTASADPKNTIAYVTNVPTHGSATEVAARFVAGWCTPAEAAARQRMVIGVNTWQSLFESLNDAKARARGLAKDVAVDGAVGTALSFVWRPIWTIQRNGRGGAKPVVWRGDSEPYLAEPASAAASAPASAESSAADAAPESGGLRGTEKNEVQNRAKLPYGLFRSTILSSTATATYANQFAAGGFEPYVHVADPDTPSLKVPKGRQRPGGDKVYMGGAFSEESETGLFDRAAELIVRRTRDRGEKTKDFPSVFAGGYQFRDPKLSLTKIAGRIDMQVRRIFFSKGTSATAAYLPEPNLMLRWQDVPKASDDVRASAATNLFGTSTGESEAIMAAIVERLTARLSAAHSDWTPARVASELRSRVAFKPAAAIATGADAGGERFRASSEQTASEVSGPKTLEEAYRQVLATEQNHAHPNAWARKACLAAEAGEAPAVQDYVRHLLFTAVGSSGGRAFGSAIQALFPDGPSEKPASVSDDAAQRLKAIAEETAALLAAFEPELQALLPKPASDAEGETPDL